MSEKMALQPGSQHENNAGADGGGDRGNQTELSAVHRSVAKGFMPASSTRLSHETAIEITRLGPDRMGEKAFEGEPARRRPITGAQTGRRGQALDRIGQGGFVID